MENPKYVVSYDDDGKAVIQFDNGLPIWHQLELFGVLRKRDPEENNVMDLMEAVLPNVGEQYTSWNDGQASYMMHTEGTKHRLFMQTPGDLQWRDISKTVLPQANQVDG